MPEGSLMSTVMTLLLGAVLGAFASVWISSWYWRPNLKIIGQGGGVSGPNRMVYSNVIVQNSIGRIGIRVGKTTILGFRVHRAKQLGFSFERQPSLDCRATLLHKGEFIVQLLWRLPTGEIAESVDLPSGRQATLMVFVCPDKGSFFFPFEHRSSDSTTIQSPVENRHFTGASDFVIQLTNHLGMRFDVPLRVEKPWGGNFKIVSTRRSWHFWKA